MGHGVCGERCSGGRGMISSWTTLFAPWRIAVPTQSDPVVAAMALGESYDTDALAGLTGQAPARLLVRLLELELRGVVRRLDGGRFVRSGRTC